MLRLYVAATASTSIGLEVAHVALIYAALLVLVIIRWLIQRGGSAERIAALQAEVSEARVQYEAVCVLLQKRTGYDDLDSEPEGDEREHLIVPPKPVVIEEGIKGMLRRTHARCCCFAHCTDCCCCDHMHTPLTSSLSVPFQPDTGKPKEVMAKALAGGKFDRDRANRIASRIRKKSYSLAAFYEDVRAAFPELQLYLASVEKKEGVTAWRM